jgi:hypothetical protein
MSTPHSTSANTILPTSAVSLDAPVFEDRASHRAEPLQRQVAHALGQLAPADVPRLRQPLEHVVQRGSTKMYAASW